MSLERFLAFSADVTAFTVFELRGTGQAELYLAKVSEVVGQDVLRELLGAYDRLLAIGAGKDRKDHDALLRRAIFGDEKLGPIARNIIKLWYVGIWYELPDAWTDKFGALAGNVTFMAAPASYAEGLLWVAIGANPPAAKAPGYASWAEPPRIPEF